MNNLLKSVFGAGSVVGIQAGSGFLGVVRVQNTIRGPRVTHAAVRDLGEAEDPADALAGILAEEDGLRAESVVSCLPSSAAELRDVEAALDHPGKLGRIIKYQIEEMVSDPIEETVVDFIPSGTNGSVLTAAVRKPILSAHLEWLSRAGLEPDRVTLDDLALFALFRRTRTGEAPPRAAALVRLGPERGGVQIVRDGFLSLFRSLPACSEGETALAEALRLDRLLHPEDGVDAVWLTGPGAVEPGCAERLEDRLGVPVSIWMPLKESRDSAGVMTADLQARLSVPLGLALGASDPVTRRFNLRREEFVRRTRAPDRRLLAGAAAALLILGILIPVHLHQQTRALEARHERLRGEMKGTLLKTFPGTPLVIKGKEAAQMEQKIREERAQYGWLEHFASRRTVLDMLAVLTTALSARKDVTVDNISMDGGTVHLDGRAPSFQAVDAVKERFEREPRFREVKLLSAKSEKGQGAVRFSFVLEEAE